MSSLLGGRGPDPLRARGLAILALLVATACIPQAAKVFPCSPESTCLEGFQCVDALCVPCPNGTCTEEVKGFIGTGGGQLCGPDNVCVQFPSGALTGDVEFVIRKPVPQPPVGSLRAASSIYEIATTNGQPLALPAARTASVRIPVDARLNPIQVAIYRVLLGEGERLTGMSTVGRAEGTTTKLGLFVAVNTAPVIVDGGMDATVVDIGPPDVFRADDGVTLLDTGVDTGMPPDTGPSDTGIHPDAPASDAPAPDALPADDGIHPDALVPDLGPPDSGVFPDAEPVEVGPVDAGGPPDPLAGAGPPTPVAAGFTSLGGVVWNDATSTLLFADVTDSVVYELGPLPLQNYAIFRSPSRQTTALARDTSGLLLTSELESRSMVRTLVDGSTVAVTTSFLGLRYNSPGDLAVRASDGTVYFVDPAPAGPFVRDLPFNGLFRVSAAGIVSPEVQFPLTVQPAGLALGPGAQVLYLSDALGALVRAYDVQPNGSLANGRVFVFTGASPSGLTADVDGNLFVATAGGVEVYSPTGTSWGVLSVPNARDLAFGGLGRTSLFITTPTSLERVDLTIAGLP